MYELPSRYSPPLLYDKSRMILRGKQYNYDAPMLSFAILATGASRYPWMTNPDFLDGARICSSCICGNKEQIWMAEMHQAESDQTRSCKCVFG